MSVVAHQGGWDEILFVLAPIALFALLLFMANRRAERALVDAGDETGDEVGDAAATSGATPGTEDAE